MSTKTKQKSSSFPISADDVGRLSSENGPPKRTGRYAVLYTRSKSTEYALGMATYRARAAGGHNKGWSGIVNERTGKNVLPCYDKRDSLVYQPTVHEWAKL